MRKALIVGIDYYEQVGSLHGCVNDAQSVSAVLERHADKKVNFAEPRVMTGTGPGNRIERAELKEAVRQLFVGDSEIALFYFAGHGHIEATGGYLSTSESRSGDDGLALAEIMTLAGSSKAANKVIILDSCHSGVAASRADMRDMAEIKEGMTILTVSTAEQQAKEGAGAGVFTTLLVDALNGAAANLLGHITPGSVYAHIDQSLGPWAEAQRPVFKTNVKSFVSLRTAIPPIELPALQQLAELFPHPDYVIPLDPGYEPERYAEQLNDPNVPPPDPSKNAIFATLQQYAKVNLVRPVDAPHMWHAAMWSKSCELTPLGRHYRRLVAKRLI